MQALAAAQAQAQLQRQMLAQQQALLGGGVAAVAAPAAMVAAAQMGSAAVAATGGVANDTQARKSREIYIGNLAIGTVTIEMLTELFNAALAGMVPDPVTNPPVLTVKMDTTGVCGLRVKVGSSSRVTSVGCFADTSGCLRAVWGGGSCCTASVWAPEL
jgi:splicing factor U2AF subunit